MEIKTRVYDYTDKKMLYFNGIFNNEPFPEKSTFVQYESIKQYHELSEPMLWTGLKDKSDIDIYENDLGKINDLIFKVEYKDGAFWKVWINGMYKDSMSLLENVKDVKIIGKTMVY